MKKLFLFTCLSILAMSFNACSGDDTSSSSKSNDVEKLVGTVSFRSDGEQKTFRDITLNKGFNGLDSIYKITASGGSYNLDHIYLEVKKGYTGADGVNYLDYTNNYISYTDVITLTSNIISNADSELTGTFKAFARNSSAPAKLITEGTFDIDLE